MRLFQIQRDDLFRFHRQFDTVASEQQAAVLAHVGAEDLACRLDGRGLCFGAVVVEAQDESGLIVCQLEAGDGDGVALHAQKRGTVTQQGIRIGIGRIVQAVAVRLAVEGAAAVEDAPVGGKEDTLQSGAERDRAVGQVGGVGGAGVGE